MTDQLHPLAEAEAQQKYRFPVVYNREFEMQAQRREAYVEGFIAGRTSVTREQIEQVIEREVDLALSSRLVLADAILALLNGENDD